MGQSYNHGSAFDYELAKRAERMHVDDIEHDKQGNIIFDEFEQKERDSERWKSLEEKYGINFGDVVKIDDHLGRVQELSVSEGDKYFDERTSDTVDMRLYAGLQIEDFHCAEVGMSAKEWLKDIKIQPKERKLSLKEKIKNTIKTKVQTFKKGGAAQRLANRRANAKDVGITR